MLDDPDTRSDWPWALSLSNLELSHKAGDWIAPEDPDACEHSWSFTLNQKVLPAWLIEAVEGRVSGPEIPDPHQQIFRTDGYIDWLSLLDAHGDELETVEVWAPTIESLQAVELLRHHGYDTSIIGTVFLLRVENRRPIYGIEAAAVVGGESFHEFDRAHFSMTTRTLKCGLQWIPDGARLDISSDPVMWHFC